MSIRFSASAKTIDHANAILHRLWVQRDQMDESEKRGLAAIAYTTIASHLEYVLTCIIELRLDSVEGFTDWNSLAAVPFNSNGHDLNLPVSPLKFTLKKALKTERNILGGAAYVKLTESYNRTFKKSFQVVVGDEFVKRLGALYELRNTFAHGRKLHFTTMVEKVTTKVDVPDQSPIRTAVEMLRAAGITPQIATPAKAAAWLDHVYEKDATLFFYKTVVDAQTKLIAQNEYPAEERRYISKLPALF